MTAPIEALEEIARQLDRDVEQLVWELRPTALDDLGLRAALDNYVRNWSQREGIAAELHTSGLLDDRLPSETETTLYRIAQEALTNAARHSRATSVDVILERRDVQVVLIIEDNGVGFDPARTTDRLGFGLIGMQERAALVGAQLADRIRGRRGDDGAAAAGDAVGHARGTDHERTAARSASCSPTITSRSAMGCGCSSRVSTT